MSPWAAEKSQRDAHPQSRVSPCKCTHRSLARARNTVTPREAGRTRAPRGRQEPRRSKPRTASCRCCPKSASGLRRPTRRRRQSLGERGTLAWLPCRAGGFIGKFRQELCACCQAHMLAGRRGRLGFLKRKAKKEGGEVCRREQGKKAHSAENRALPKHPCSHLVFVQASACVSTGTSGTRFTVQIGMVVRAEHSL